MARYTYTVYINGSLVSNVQSLTIQTGRASVQDPYRAGTAVINGRNLSTFVQPVIGQHVLIYAGPQIMFDGSVADVSVNYGIVANQDLWEVRCEDILGNAGRAVTSDSWTSGTSCYIAARDITDTTTIDLFGLGSGSVGSYASAQSLTDVNLLSTLQTLVQTEQGRILGLTNTQIGWLGRNDMNNMPSLVSFTDGSLTPSDPVGIFDGVKFASLADNYATKVQVNPSGLASQTAGTGYRTYSMESYDVSTTQALNLAQFVNQTLDVSSAVPSSITCLAEEQPALNESVRSLAQFGNTGFQCEIILRGVRYQCIVEGSTISATPESSRFTFFLSASEAYDWLVLNDSVFGRLDYNKLGF